jgi:hypothetical protein
MQMRSLQLMPSAHLLLLFSFFNLPPSSLKTRHKSTKQRAETKADTHKRERERKKGGGKQSMTLEEEESIPFS